MKLFCTTFRARCCRDGRRRAPAIAHQRVHKTHHRRRLADTALESQTGLVHVRHGFWMRGKPKLLEHARGRWISHFLCDTLQSVGVAVYVPRHEKVNGGELQYVILGVAQLRVSVAHVHGHVGAQPKRVRAHFLGVPHDVFVRPLVGVKGKAQNRIFFCCGGLEALRAVGHTRALSLPRVFRTAHGRRRSLLVAQHNTKKLRAHDHFVGFGERQCRWSRHEEGGGEGRRQKNIR